MNFHTQNIELKRPVHQAILEYGPQSEDAEMAEQPGKAVPQEPVDDLLAQARAGRAQEAERIGADILLAQAHRGRAHAEARSVLE